MCPSSLVACLAMVVSVGDAGVPAADRDRDRGPYLVVLATLQDKATGEKAALRAADRLGVALAPDTFANPVAHRIYVGRVITLQRWSDERFAVVSFLGSKVDAMAALAGVHKHFPDARVMPADDPPNADVQIDDSPYIRMGLLVLGSFTTYQAALRAAQAWSRRSGHAYSSRGMLYDKQRGLIFPDDFADQIFAGNYVPRRSADECGVQAEGKLCLTVERSDGYEGFAPGLYIVVGGLLGAGEGRDKALAVARKVAAGAYVKQTTIYLGCMH
jgi:hypothetical protein